MRAGLLRHKVRIERQSTTKDTHNQPINTWTLIAERRASIEPLNGKEYFSANAENSEVTTRIRLRYETLLSDLNTNDRVVHGSTIYDIQSVINPRLRNRELILMCKASNGSTN